MTEHEKIILEHEETIRLLTLQNENLLAANDKLEDLLTDIYTDIRDASGKFKEALGSLGLVDQETNALKGDTRSLLRALGRVTKMVTTGSIDQISGLQEGTAIITKYERVMNLSNIENPKEISDGQE